jgi:ATP-dependent exoDNAse (exonuclease V) beta subunit
VDFVLDETQLAARLVAIGESPNALDSFRHDALQAECDGVSIRDWSNEMCRRLHNEAQGIVETGNEIQMLTCWKAKGLEWPVVIPLGLGRKISRVPDVYPLVQQEADGVKVHLSAATLDPVFEKSSETKEREELQRLLYVTFTRAKSLLVLPDSSAIYNRTMPNFLDLCKWDELAGKSFLQTLSTRTPPEGVEARSEPRLHVAPAQTVCERAALRSREIPRRILPHELVHDPSRDLPDREPAGDIGGMDYGSWWHRTMQYFPWLQNEADRTEYAEKAGKEAAGVSAVRERGVRELHAFVWGKFHAELLASGEFFLSETPFSHPRSEHEWMEGVIDLVVVIRGGGVWIVDWKTDRRLVGESADQFRSRLRDAYLPQLEAYAEVVRDGMRRGVERLALYSTESGFVID